MSRTRNYLGSLLVIVAMALPVVAVGSREARADVSIHVHGHVHGQVRVGRSHRVRPSPPRTPARGVQLHVGGAVYIGGFSQPPPPPPPQPCDCDSGSVPAYYAEPPPPPPPAPPVPAVAAPVPVEPGLPRLGIGVFAGSITVEDRTEGEELGLIGRVRLTDKWQLEAELAKTEMATARMDRRVGGAVIYDIAPWSRWSAHLLAGVGMAYIDVDQGVWQAQQEYGELGAGLTWRLSPRFHIAGDLRVGSRRAVDGAPADLALKSIAPSSDQDERFTRGRASAIFYF